MAETKQRQRQFASEVSKIFNFRGSGSYIRELRVIIVGAALATLLALPVIVFSGPLSAYFNVSAHLARLAALTTAGSGAAIFLLMLSQAYLKYGSIALFSPDFGEEPGLNGRSRNVRSQSGRGKMETPPEEPELEPHDELAMELQIRLDLEIQAQNRKANLNLGIGTIGAVVALLILGLSVFFPPTTTHADVFWATVAGRAMLSVTASVFAFFFLSTYRRNLSEIRYFHNEMTNVESKLLALRLFNVAPLVKRDKGDAALLGMLQGLAETERNFVLKKGETTTDLSQKDLDRQEQLAWLQALAAMQAAVEPSASQHNGAAKPTRRKPQPAH